MMSSSLQAISRRLIFVVAIVIGLSRLASAVEPATNADLTRYVGANVGICLEISNLQQHGPRVYDSLLMQRLRNTGLYTNWHNSKDARKLTKVRETLARLANRPFDELATGLLGQSVVVAVYPVPDREPVGVLLTQTAGSNILETALETWNRAEPQLTTDFTHAGRTYNRRIARAKQDKAGAGIFYVTLGAVVAISDDQAAIQQVIDLANEPAVNTAGLPGLAVYQKSRQALSTGTFASVFLNPRVWDEPILKENANDPIFTMLWRRFEALSFGVRTTEAGMALEAVIHYDNADIDTRWTQFIDITQGSPDFLKRVPNNAFAAIAGRYAPGIIGKLIPVAEDDPDQQKWESFRQVSQGLLLGRGLFDDILPAFEADWGAYAVPRENLIEGAIPAEALLALRLPAKDAESTEQKSITLRAALDNGLNTGLNLLTAVYNSKSPAETAIVKSEDHQEITIRWMDSYGPYRPAYAATSEYLVFASTPDLVRQFIDNETATGLLADPTFQQTTAGLLHEGDQHVIYLNVAMLRTFLAANTAFFVEQATKSNDNSHAAQHIASIIDLLGIFDAAIVTSKANHHEIRLTIAAAAESPPTGKSSDRSDR